MARGLTKAFSGRTVVDGVDLRVDPGEIVGLLGPNGAGKTTTFRLLLGLTPPDRGAVSLGDRALDGMPLHRRAGLGLGYLPQGASVFRGLTVLGNLLVILEALGRPRSRERAADLLERYGLSHLGDRRARTLSGGERRRLEFARCLCSDPGILLADEPFAGVDPIAVNAIAGAITDLKLGGVGVLLTDHAVREALGTCDRVYLIVEGRIVASGTPEEIRASEIARRLYLGAGFD